MAFLHEATFMLPAHEALRKFEVQVTSRVLSMEHGPPEYSIEKCWVEDSTALR